uniref:C2H2-type domain-containing protein n=1 Tax=Timema tahoe TaxID=61484 RepID=A0A7R9IP21_9NEOP|nr:unnamed protein product [Timema tahoe]
MDRVVLPSRVASFAGATFAENWASPTCDVVYHVQHLVAVLPITDVGNVLPGPENMCPHASLFGDYGNLLKRNLMKPIHNVRENSPEGAGTFLSSDFSSFFAPKASSQGVDNVKYLPFICSNCGKAYKYKNNLKRHFTYECGREPLFHCLYCPHKTTRKTSLQTHVKLIHTHL